MGERPEIEPIRWEDVDDFKRSERPPPAVASPPGIASHPESLPTSVETLPLTPAMRVALRVRVWIYTIVFTVVTVAFGVGMLFLVRAAARDVSLTWWLILLIVAATLVWPGIGGWIIYRWLADLRHGTFVRAAGPVRVMQVGGKGSNSGWYRLHIGDQSFTTESNVATAIDGMAFGTVDYGERSNNVFAVRDVNGAERYRLRWYRRTAGDGAGVGFEPDTRRDGSSEEGDGDG